MSEIVYPRTYKERSELDPLLGIKSSLSKIRSVVAMTYVLYLANDKKYTIEYCEESIDNGTTRITLKKEIEDKIKQMGFKIVDLDNQLLSIQFEPLYVGLSLMFALAKLSFCDKLKSNTCERTGGNRYAKKLDFTSNIILLDLILEGFSQSERIEGIQNWLENKKANTSFEERICKFLTLQVHKVLSKVKTNNGDLIYRLEGIYEEILKGNKVTFGDLELVGPTRILNNVISEGIDIHLRKINKTIEINESLKEETQNWFNIVNTTFDLSNVKSPIEIESSNAIINENADNGFNSIIEPTIANYITQHDKEIISKEKLQIISNDMYEDASKDKMLTIYLFGILYAPVLEKYGANNFTPEVKNADTGLIEKKDLGPQINNGKNIGLFLRKLIHNRACSTLTPEDLDLMKQYIDIFTTALKTKPFLLLAGISGTGKSQKVKELAYATCPEIDECENMRTDKTKPANYCMIEVKPNWHDSTELLGYWSNLSQKYMITDFIRFAHKAMKHPNIPFFLCLDEMNLAPVEQYFAEYLSVLESRKVVEGKIVSEPLISKDIFKDCSLSKDFNQKYTEDDKKIIEDLKINGLRLPENLFVIGTVNMDDTTHQFSRKVIDRAFTIEMNGGKLEDMFSTDNNKKLEYRPNGQEAKLELFKSNYTKATDAIESDKVKPFAEEIKNQVPEKLNAINRILDKTPFKVSYRVQNEMVLYICNIIEATDGDINIDAIINTALLATLLEKILPRVQGDERLLKHENSNVFTALKKYVEDLQIDLKTTDTTDFKSLVMNKLDDMSLRLSNSYFASFFG